MPESHPKQSCHRDARLVMCPWEMTARQPVPDGAHAAACGPRLQRPVQPPPLSVRKPFFFSRYPISRPSGRFCVDVVIG